MNLENFNFLSQGLIDKLIFYDEGSLVASQFLIPTTGLTERFLPFLIYSVDGTTWYKGGTSPYNSSGTPLYDVRASSISGSVVVDSNTTGFYQILGVPADE